MREVNDNNLFVLSDYYYLTDSIKITWKSKQINFV